MSLAIDIAIEHDDWATLGDIDGLVARAGDAALAASGQSISDGTEVSLLLCNDAFIRELNKNWRGKDKATNVLSFPTQGHARDHALGDVIIAYETAAREAKDEDRLLTDHVAHLFVHGLFHLLGFDHETDDEADEMERLESRALTTLGITSPYIPIPDAKDTHAPP